MSAVLVFEAEAVRRPRRRGNRLYFDARPTFEAVEDREPLSVLLANERRKIRVNVGGKPTYEFDGWIAEFTWGGFVDGHLWETVGIVPAQFPAATAAPAPRRVWRLEEEEYGEL